MVNLAEINVKYSQNSTIIICDKTVSTLEEINYKQFNIQNLCEYLLKKAPIFSFPEIISKQLETTLIKKIIDELFSTNEKYSKIVKTNFFENYLSEFFELFICCDINTNDLFNLLEKLDINDTEKERFNVIVLSYQKYLEKLNELNLLTTKMLPKYLIHIFEKNPNFLNFIKKDIKQFLLDKGRKYTPTELNLLKIIAPTKEIDLCANNHNKASNAILNKYIKPEQQLPTQKLNDFRLISFNDVRDEITFTAKEIIEKIQKENASLSDFTIIVASQTHKKAINDIFTMANIYTNIEETCEEYEYFKIRIKQILSICEAQKNLKKATNRLDMETIHNEINTHFENIMSSILQNQFAKDKFLELLESTNSNSLIECVKKYSNILTKEDAQKLNNEIKRLETSSELYKKGEIVQIFLLFASLEKASSEFKSYFAHLLQKIEKFEAFNKKLKNYEPDFIELIKLIDNSKSTIKTKEKNYVKIIDIQKKELEPTKNLYIIGLNEKVYPKTDTNINFLTSEAQEKIYAELNKPDTNFSFLKNNIKNSAENLAEKLTQTTDNLTITSHKYEEKKQTAPSIFFQYLISVFPESFTNSDFIYTPTKKQQQFDFKETTFVSDIVIKDEDILKLSASAISNFQKCPRKFYFSNLIGLTQTSSFAANYGSIVHYILENLNKNYLDKYSKIIVAELCNLLFNSINDKQKALEAGFNEREIDLICATDLLSLSEMQTAFLSALDELDKINFFNEKPEEIICEKSFSFSLDALPNVIFDGRIDAIYKFKDKYIVVDYKTGKTYGELNYYISENGVTFKTKSGQVGNVEKLANEYSYQIPLYYLACQNSQDLEMFKDKIESFDLLYIRPKNQNGGIYRDTVKASIINQYSENIIKNLKETIIDKIRNREYFEPRYSEFNCKNCGFKFLCDTSDKEENE